VINEDAFRDGNFLDILTLFTNISQKYTMNYNFRKSTMQNSAPGVTKKSKVVVKMEGVSEDDEDYSTSKATSSGTRKSRSLWSNEVRNL